jgi:hypothetical protein
METAIAEAIRYAASALAGVLMVCIAIIGFGGKWAVSAIDRRLAAQDVALMEIRDLLASEVKQLREMQHATDVRLTRLEVERSLRGNHVVG